MNMGCSNVTFNMLLYIDNCEVFLLTVFEFHSLYVFKINLGSFLYIP